jgi:hypothetical protein
MTITLDLPDDIAQHANAGREALEALALEGYRSGALTHHQASRLVLIRLTQQAPISCG